MRFYKDLLIRYINFNSYKKASIYDRIKCVPIFSSISEAVKHLDDVNSDAIFRMHRHIEPSINVDLYMINIIDEIMIAFLRECMETIHSKYVNSDDIVDDYYMSLDQAIIKTMDIRIASGDNVNDLILKEIINFTEECMDYTDNFDSKDYNGVRYALSNISRIYYNIMESLHIIASVKNRRDDYFRDMVGVYKHLCTLKTDTVETGKVMVGETVYDIK